MATIKIPSSQIYNVGDRNRSFLKFVELSCNFNRMERGVIGTYKLTPYISTGDGTAHGYEYVGYNDDYNDVDIELTSVGEEIEGDYVETSAYGTVSQIIFPATPTAKIKLVDNMLENCKLTITKRFENYTDENEEQKNQYTDKLSFTNNNQFIWIDHGYNADILPSYSYYRTLIKRFAVEYCTSIDFEVEGDCITSQSKNENVGDIKSKLKISLPSNELVQTNNKYTSGSIYSAKVLNDTLKKYQNGKEVYTIKCSVGNYYDTSGNLAICPTNTDYPAIFKKYDIVRPYVFTSQGEVPLSTKADGTPKEFEIIGIDYSYKGVVWQELTIQENT